jgi:glycosyltransferase involved in cell wall biosynthesis
LSPDHTGGKAKHTAAASSHPQKHAQLRIAIVEFSPFGGMYQFALQMAEALAGARQDVELICGTAPELQPRASSIKLSSILPACRPDKKVVSRARGKLRRVMCGFRYIAAWCRLLIYLTRNHPDVLQWGVWRFAIDGWLVTWLARCPGAPVMTDVAHTPRPLATHRSKGRLSKSGPLMRSALARAYGHMDAVLVLGEQSRRELIETWPEVRRVEVIPHGDENILACRDTPSPDEAGPSVLFFGVLTRYKGLELLLNAFELLRRRLPEAQLLIAGVVGRDVDFAVLAQRASRIGAIELRPGYVPLPDVPDLVGQSRLVVLPYRAANQSGVLHLARTFARPVVVTDVGDLAALITHGHDGIVVPPADPIALAAALEELLVNPAEAARLGRNGRARMEAESSWSRVAECVLALYKELVAEKASSKHRCKS